MAGSDELQWKEELRHQRAEFPETLDTVFKAGFWRRYWALSIDLFILGLLSSALYGIFSTGWFPDLVSLLLYLFFFAWPYSGGGQTPGKSLLGIRVVSIDGSPLNWKMGILRVIGYVPSSLFLYLGFLWAIGDRHKQAWHDKIAGTVVIRGNPSYSGFVDLSEAKQIQKRWLVGLGIPIILGIFIIGFIFLPTLFDGEELDAWPDDKVPIGKIVEADLSHLGLLLGRKEDAVDNDFWSGGGFEDGNVLFYEKDKKTVVVITGLSYASSKKAGRDFEILDQLVEENCGFYTSWIPGETGVITCRFNDGFQKFYLHETYIIEVTAGEGTEYPPKELVDEVREALAVHWTEQGLID